jgi:hypothetical protein
MEPQHHSNFEPASRSVGVVLSGRGGAEHAEVARRINAIISAEVCAANTENDLTRKCDRLVRNEELPDLFVRAGRSLQVADLEAAPVEIVRFHARLSRLVGSLLADKVGSTLSETARLVIEGIRRRLAETKNAEAEVVEHEIPEDYISAETFERSSLYMAERRFPVSFRRALFGRDVAQIAIVAVANAEEWKLSRERVVELCDTYVSNQGLWLDVIAQMADVEVKRSVLPVERRNHKADRDEAETIRLLQDAHLQVMREKNEDVHYYIERDPDAADHS